MRAIIVKEFRELARDRRTLAMLVALPIILLVIFGYAANFSVDRVHVMVIGPHADELRTELAATSTARDRLTFIAPDREDARRDDRETAVDLLQRHAADAVVIATAAPTNESTGLADRMRVYLDGSSVLAAQTAQGTFLKLVAEDGQNRLAEIRATAEQARTEASAAQAEFTRFGEQLAAYAGELQRALAAGTAPPPPPSPPTAVALPDFPEITAPSGDPDSFIAVEFNPDLKTSWVMVPGLIGLILLFIGALITSIGLVRERETGTLEQLAVMPLRPAAIIAGKIAPYFLLALIDMAAVTALGVWLFGVPFVGSLPLFTLAAVVFLFVVLGAGVFISSVSQNTGQAIQMAILFVVPQVLLSGLIFPLEAMPLGVRWIGYALPLTWFREISQGVMLRGAGLDTLWLPLTVLAGMAVLVFGAATLRMRHSLTHGGAR